VGQDKQQVIVAVGADLAPGPGAEQIDPLRPQRLHEAANDLGEGWIHPGGGLAHAADATVSVRRR